MTLKQALKVICETRYNLVVHSENGYESIKIDYIHDDKCTGGSFTIAAAKRDEVIKAKNRVNWISYNNALNMIEISVDMIA